MKKLLIILAAAGLVLSAEAAMAQQKKTLAVVVKGLDNPFFTVLGNGCKKWNNEHPNSEYRVPLYRPGADLRRSRRGPARRRPHRQGRGGDRHLALQCPGHGIDAEGKEATDADHDDRCRSPARGSRVAQDLSRHQELSDGRADGQAPGRSQAEGRQGLPAARQCRREQHQWSAPPAFATRFPARRASNA